MILCGGQSRRMGQDKALLELGGKTMLEYQYQRLVESRLFTEVFLSSKKHYKGSWGSNIFMDLQEISSPINGLCSILEQSNCEQNFIIPVDTPLVSLAQIQALQEAFRAESNLGVDALVFKDSSHIHSLLGIYTKKSLSGLYRMLKNNILKISEAERFIWIKYLECDEVKFFQNANTKEEYQAILRDFGA